MSASLDLVHSIYADWERGNFSSVGWADPEIEYVEAEMGRFPRTSSHGVIGLAEAARARLEVLEDVRELAEEYRELDDGRVLVPNPTREGGNAAASSWGCPRAGPGSERICSISGMARSRSLSCTAAAIAPSRTSG